MTTVRHYLFNGQTVTPLQAWLIRLLAEQDCWLSVEWLSQQAYESGHASLCRTLKLLERRGWLLVEHDYRRLSAAGQNIDAAMLRSETLAGLRETGLCVVCQERPRNGRTYCLRCAKQGDRERWKAAKMQDAANVACCSVDGCSSPRHRLSSGKLTPYCHAHFLAHRRAMSRLYIAKLTVIAERGELVCARCGKTINKVPVSRRMCVACRKVQKLQRKLRAKGVFNKQEKGA